jgi:hypothetical protein
VRDLVRLGHRGSATQHERRAADYLCGELRELGLELVVERFPGRSSAAATYLLHLGITITATAGGGEGIPPKIEAGKAQRTPTGYLFVPVDVGWAFQKLETAGVKEPGAASPSLIAHGWNIRPQVPLPASLPDDRRERTRVEILP